MLNARTYLTHQLNINETWNSSVNYAHFLVSDYGYGNSII